MIKEAVVQERGHMSGARGDSAALRIELCSMATSTAEYDLRQGFDRVARDSFGNQQGTLLKSTASSLLAQFSQVNPAFFAAIRMLKSGIGDNIRLRAGLHFGADGEASTVASEVCQLAGAGEVLLTGSTLPYLCRHFREQCSALPPVNLPGRPNLDLHACKKLAGEETVIGGLETSLPLSDRTSFLLLSQADIDVMVTPDSVPLSIGRASDCDIKLVGNRCSRIHAYIERQNDNYILRDQSSNGTLLVMPPDVRFVINRESRGLEGSGTLIFGGSQTNQAEDVLDFAVVDSPLN